MLEGKYDKYIKILNLIIYEIWKVMGKKIYNLWLLYKYLITNLRVIFCIII